MRVRREQIRIQALGGIRLELAMAVGMILVGRLLCDADRQPGEHVVGQIGHRVESVADHGSRS